MVGLASRQKLLASLEAEVGQELEEVMRSASISCPMSSIS